MTSGRIDGVLRFLRHFPTGLTKSAQKDLAETIVHESRHYGFDPELILAVITAESSFNIASRSPKGALGLMQLLPETASEMVGQENPDIVETLLLDPVMNVRLGVRYLAYLVGQFGNLETALTAYNRGIGSVSQRAEDIKSPQDPYADKILRQYHTLLASDISPYAPSTR